LLIEVAHARVEMADTELDAAWGTAGGSLHVLSPFVKGEAAVCTASGREGALSSSNTSRMQESHRTAYEGLSFQVFELWRRWHISCCAAQFEPNRD